MVSKSYKRDNMLILGVLNFIYLNIPNSIIDSKAHFTKSTTISMSSFSLSIYKLMDIMWPISQSHFHVSYLC